MKLFKMKGSHMESTVEEQQFGQLRARVEATFLGPTMIVVTSGTRGDGKSATAYGLAASLADADHRVLLIDANVAAPTLSRSHHSIPSSRIELARVSNYATPVAGQRFKGLSLADERLESGMSMEKIKAAVADFQNHFDFTIVDAAPLIQSNLAVLFATIADGTILAIRLGRLATVSDDESLKTLTRVGANVLGALTVTPKLIKSFRARMPAVERDVFVPRRHITTKHSMGPEPAREVAESSSNSTFVS
jgi:succinoglycan biosynthesis transport protein ExoP